MTKKQMTETANQDSGGFRGQGTKFLFGPGEFKEADK